MPVKYVPFPCFLPTATLLGIPEIETPSIESVDPLIQAIESASPEEFFLFWIESLNRPMVTILDDEPTPGYISLYVTREDADRAWRGMRRFWRWRGIKIEIWPTTLLDALSMARNLPMPTVLLGKLGVCQRMGGILIETDGEFVPL